MNFAENLQTLCRSGRSSMVGWLETEVDQHIEDLIKASRVSLDPAHE